MDEHEIHVKAHEFLEAIEGAVVQGIAKSTLRSELAAVFTPEQTELLEAVFGSSAVSAGIVGAMSALSVMVRFDSGPDVTAFLHEVRNIVDHGCEPDPAWN